MKRVLFIPLLLAVLGTSGIAGATQTTYDKEQVKKDYRAFLEQLKVLNAQYKEITGEIGQVVKEEGLPQWDMGKGLDLGDKKNEETTQDLGGGAYLKETSRDMVLTLDLPGYKKDSIKLSFRDGKTLQITAQRKLEAVTRSYDRSFDLPSPGDQKNSQASYEDGVLTVKIPRLSSQEVSIPVK